MRPLDRALFPLRGFPIRVRLTGLSLLLPGLALAAPAFPRTFVLPPGLRPPSLPSVGLPALCWRLAAPGRSSDRSRAPAPCSSCGSGPSGSFPRCRFRPSGPRRFRSSRLSSWSVVVSGLLLLPVAFLGALGSLGGLAVGCDPPVGPPSPSIRTFHLLHWVYSSPSPGSLRRTV